MKVLFYIRQTHGKITHIAKHPEYMLHDEPNQESLAFFESPKPVKMISMRLFAERIDRCITSVQTTLPYVCTTIELIDRVSPQIESKNMYIYLGLGDLLDPQKTKCVLCAFATFERLDVNRDKVFLKCIFNKVANETSDPNEIFDYQENRRLRRYSENVVPPVSSF